MRYFSVLFMRKIAFISLLLIYCGSLPAQLSFKTVVPEEALVEGESFNVQYVVEDMETVSGYVKPSFKNFIVVNGPQMYQGEFYFNGKRKPLNNTVYTLNAIKPGKFRVPGIEAIVNGRKMRSNDAWVIVISRKEAMRNRRQNGGIDENSASFLKPNEDPYKKIKENLFVRVQVDKKVCFAGEPVVATFKLYSRLRSQSDIIKNPGFYGFTVQDMISLNDRVSNVERINGEIYDVHTIRQVQLYPLRAGNFSIDRMELINQVEFSTSAVSKRPEQDIFEGIFDDPMMNPGTDVKRFETSISTEPINITVKPVPDTNKPANYTGATGLFSIKTSLEKNELAKNEEGYLRVSITGSGNFSQLEAPVINWPANVEGFAPSVIDTLDKMFTPLKGSRTFRYAFIASEVGQYNLPAISFSFFNPDSNRFKTVTSKTLGVTATNKAKPTAVIRNNNPKVSIADINRKYSLIAAGIILVVVLVVLVYWLTRKKEKVKRPEIRTIYISPTEMLEPAMQMIPAESKDFYTALQQCTWNFLEQYFDFSKTGRSKHSLRQFLLAQQTDPKIIAEFEHLLDTIGAGIYTGAEMVGTRSELVDTMRYQLERLVASNLQQ